MLSLCDLTRRCLFIPASLLALTLATEPLRAETPDGFTPLSNGVDLSGWHGMTTFDVRKLDAMSPEDRQKQLDEWNATIPEH